MVKITKVYTKTGDKGTTSLPGSRRINKTDAEIEVLGSLDELNSFIGFAITVMHEYAALSSLIPQCQRIQQDLFNLGAQLAVGKDLLRDDTPRISEHTIEQLESDIDRMNTELNTLTSFILPGGFEVSARLHLARAVCRRAERDVFKLAASTDLCGTEGPYLNRLSDWLFVAARWASKQCNEKEILWEPSVED